MLNSLYIENIAVIEKTDIELYPGLNILTGETGAGKSIVIDAINAVMGHRTSKEIIRNGADNATVFATFSDINDIVKNKLSESGYTLEDDELVISRTLSQTGKNTCRINGKPANVSLLRELGLNLINIHGQHESYELFSPDTHITYIDNLADNCALLSEYKAKYIEYKRLSEEYDAFIKSEENREQRIDLLSYQVNELEQAGISVGESEALSDERRVLMNAEKITSALHKAKEHLDGNTGAGAVDILDDAVTSLQKASDLNPEFEVIFNRLNDLYYEVQDVGNDIAQAIDESEENPYRLEEIEERLDLLNKLSRKYGKTEEDMLAFLDNAVTELEKLQKFDENASELKQKCIEAKAEAQAAADKLTKSRTDTARDFEARVKTEMNFLDMPGVELVVSQKKTELKDNGQDRIELLISANPGESPKPVAKIASGGELSRMMLAIKTVLASTDVIDTLIFDEVDTGVSGSAAQKVGLKLKEVSKSRQVICVTHQAQIAALADSHFLIEKNVRDSRTFTEIKLLDTSGRLSELARILDGVTVTDTALAHAQKLMDYNK
ncbi:MAG: DNA repair protein RecN [Ruminococcus sp.]|nr:DNA repair protein RecN [Ruminococcus sp.]